MSYSREPYLIAEQQTIRNFNEDWGIVFNQISSEIGMPGSEGFPRKNFNYRGVVTILKELICQYKQFKNIGDIPLIGKYVKVIDDMHDKYIEEDVVNYKIPFCIIYSADGYREAFPDRSEGKYYPATFEERQAIRLENANDLAAKNKSLINQPAKQPTTKQATTKSSLKRKQPSFKNEQTSFTTVDELLNGL